MNRFDPETHTYYMDEVAVPSVTQVIADVVPTVWPCKDLEWYGDRGSAVHSCSAMIALGQEFDLPDDDNRDYMEGCVASIRAFFHEVKPVVCAVEERMYSSRYRFGGTLDLLATIEGRLTLLDWKTSLPKTLPYQMGGYGVLADPNFPVRWARGIEYSPTGKYKMGDLIDLRRYKAGFLALLGAYNIRRECGIKQEDGI